MRSQSDLNVLTKTNNALPMKLAINRSYLFVFLSLVIAIGLGCSTAPPPPTGGKETYVTQLNQIPIEAGLGADQRPLIVKAVSLIKTQQLTDAGHLLDQALATFHGLMTNPDVKYVSAPTKAELDAFSTGSNTASNTIWVDWSFREALHLKAFIESASKRFEVALQFLDEEATYAPTAAAPYLERGYILSQQGKPSAALEAYTRALAQSRKYASSAGTEGAALRGMGVVLVDLHDLYWAERYLQESLKIDPGNRVAIKELEYIRQLRAAGSTQ